MAKDRCESDWLMDCCQLFVGVGTVYVTCQVMIQDESKALVRTQTTLRFVSAAQLER
jgi:hypothetical protein